MYAANGDCDSDGGDSDGRDEWYIVQEWKLRIDQSACLLRPDRVRNITRKSCCCAAVRFVIMRRVPVENVCVVLLMRGNPRVSVRTESIVRKDVRKAIASEAVEA